MLVALCLSTPLAASDQVAGFIIKPRGATLPGGFISEDLAGAATVPLQLVKPLSGQSALYKADALLSADEAETIATALSARPDGTS